VASEMLPSTVRELASASNRHMAECGVAAFTREARHCAGTGCTWKTFVTLALTQAAPGVLGVSPEAVR